MEISQKVEQKVMENRRQKIRKLEDESRRFNIQMGGVPERESRVNRGESSMK